jgi:hypothetical protein
MEKHRKGTHDAFEGFVDEFEVARHKAEEKREIAYTKFTTASSSEVESFQAKTEATLSQQSEVIATINEGLSLGLAAKADKAEMLGKLANKAGHEDIEKTYKAMAQQHTALTEELAASEERKVSKFLNVTCSHF